MPIRTTCALWLLPLLMLLLLPAVGQAQYNYTTNNSGITITGYTGPGGAVIIPSTITGLPVTSIGNFAFNACSGLTSITMPNSVISIGQDAFAYCTGLTNVTIPTNVTSIGIFTFSQCTNLTNVTIPNSVTNIGQNAFNYCSSLTNVTIPKSVTSIGTDAFYNCTNLTMITVDALNGIYSSLSGVLFNKSQTILIQCPGGKAGNYTLPNSVTSIQYLAFHNCPNLTMITVDVINSVYSSVNGVLFNKNQTTLIQCPGGKSGTYTVPNSATTIAVAAFQYCTKLTSITISNNVTSIGDVAFVYCIRLTNITLPSSVTNFGGGTFEDCHSLTSITIPNNVTSIGVYTFFNCFSLTNVTIPNSVTTIGDLAFESCSSLINVTIPNNVTNVGNNVFEYCFGLKSITIGNSITSIGIGAFQQCTGLTNVTIPNSVTNIGDNAFYDCSSLTMISVDVLNSVYSSVNGVLFNKNQTKLIRCPGGKSGTYTVPNSVTTIGEGAFGNCYKLTNVTIPNTVTTIGSAGRSSVFFYCTHLTGVYFQGNAPSVISDVFNGANSVIVYYLLGTTGWGSTLGGRPTVLWNPQVQTSDSSFGVRTNRFGFTLTGTSNLVLVVDACTNLTTPSWSPVQTNTLTNGSFYFSDAQWTNYPGRFYRVRTP